MNPGESIVLQIVPHLPGSHDGVGDYALNLAKALSKSHGLRTRFVVAGATATKDRDGFEIVSGLETALSRNSSARRSTHVILHYANYGYQRWGVPFQLRRFAREVRSGLRGRWITTFHELYASAPPWKSAFWARPFQTKIARDLVDISDSCFVSNDVIRKAISDYDPATQVHFLPVMSNFGEPEITDFGDRSPTCWAICGGTGLIARSLGSLIALQQNIPKTYFPTRLEIIGGRPEEGVRELVQSATGDMPGVSINYHPDVTAMHASQVLTGCSFGWLDYYGSGKPWPGMIFKSSSFAALCAHGVIPVLSHAEPMLGIGGDKLPGPYRISNGTANLPEFDQLPAIRRQLYEWYRRHASSEQAARVYMEALA